MIILDRYKISYQIWLIVEECREVCYGKRILMVLKSELYRLSWRERSRYDVIREVRGKMNGHVFCIFPHSVLSRQG